MKKVLVLVGISGSGKSTWARQYCQEHENLLRISRDEIRRSILPVSLGAYWGWPREDQQRIEKLVDRLHTRLFMEALRDNWQIIMDNTHLKKEYLDEYKTLLLRNFPSFTIEYKLFSVPTELCQERDHARPDSVGAQVIAQQQLLLDELIQQVTFQPFIWPIPND